jgi:(2Fe-2S) ferredoxin
MPAPFRHVFVCLNERPAAGRPACGGRGAPALFTALQRAIGARPDLAAQVAVTGCRCLGPCYDGPTLVVYPDAVWYAGAQASDAEEIVHSHLLGGCPVERLRHRWPDDQGPDSGDDERG